MFRKTIYVAIQYDIAQFDDIRVDKRNNMLYNAKKRKGIYMPREKRSVEYEKYSTVKKFESVFSERLSKLIKAKIKDKGKDKVSKRLGVSNRVIELWAAQQSRPDIDRLPMLADYLGVTVDYLVGRSNTPDAPTLESAALIEKYGLIVDTQDTIECYNEHKKGRYGDTAHKYGIDFINKFISWCEFDGISICNSIIIELYSYIENIKYCAFLEKTYPGIDFSVARSNSIFSGSVSDEKRIKEIKEKEQRDNEKRNDYNKAKGKARHSYLQMLEYFREFLCDYGDNIVETFDYDGYVGEAESDGNEN